MRLPTSRSFKQSIWGRSERPYRWGLIGIFFGLLALLAATQFEFDWLSRERAALRAEAQAQAEAKKSISVQLGDFSVSVGGSKNTKGAGIGAASVPDPHPAWNWAAKALGALALLLALVALLRQEDWRPILLALVLGLSGIAFHGMYMLASAALFIILVLAVLAALGS